MPQPQPPDEPETPPLERNEAENDEPIPCHEAVHLTNGGAVAHIRLNGQHYALRITRQGKLILTK